MMSESVKSELSRSQVEALEKEVESLKRQLAEAKGVSVTATAVPSDTAIEAEILNAESEMPPDNRTFIQRMKDAAKKVGKVAYNSTVGEVASGRVPVLDTAYRSYYYKRYNPTTGKEVFDGPRYYKLGSGGKRSRKHRRKSKKHHGKSRKNRK
jgi:hypothetical protein